MTVSSGDRILLPRPIITLPRLSITAMSRSCGNFKSDRGIPTRVEEGEIFSSTIFAWSWQREEIDRIVSSWTMAKMRFATLT